MSFETISFPFKKYIFSFVLAFCVTIVFQAIVSVVFSFFPPGEKIFSVLCNVFPYFSAFLAAFFCAFSHGKRGLVTGLISGNIYMLLLLLCGILFFKNTPVTSEILRSFAISSVCGIAGGIIGINSK